MNMKSKIMMQLKIDKCKVSAKKEAPCSMVKLYLQE